MLLLLRLRGVRVGSPGQDIRREAVAGPWGAHLRGTGGGERGVEGGGGRGGGVPDGGCQESRTVEAEAGLDSGVPRQQLRGKGREVSEG